MVMASLKETLSDVQRMSTPLDMGCLWCVCVIGPGTVFAQPTRRLAEARAAVWQEPIDRMFLNEPRCEHDPVIYCTVRPWEGTAEEHAADLMRHNGEPKEIC